MVWLAAVFVDTFEEKLVVAIQPKPAFRPLREMASTSAGSGMVLINETPPDFGLSYSVGLLAVEALSAIAESNSFMYLYKHMSSGRAFEEAFGIIHGSSCEKAKPILAPYVSSTMKRIYNEERLGRFR